MDQLRIVFPFLKERYPFGFSVDKESRVWHSCPATGDRKRMRRPMELGDFYPMTDIVLTCDDCGGSITRTIGIRQKEQAA